MIKAVIGLGNPGQEYRDTRHNIGFMVIDSLRHCLNCSGKQERCFSHIYSCKQYDVLLVKPQTYMNLSGNAVLNLLKDYKLSPQQVLVVHDDLDLPLGTVKLRKSGSSGGHKGIKSIIEKIRTEEFSRLRVGIGRPEKKEDIADYVISPFSSIEKLVIEKVISHCDNCILSVLKYGVDKSMNLCNKKLL